MGVKNRKIHEEEEMEKKQTETSMEDRLSNLPEDLQIRILSCLQDTKHVVQTSMLSKRWVSLWTWIPVLDLNCYDVNIDDKFVDRVLCLRDQSAKLDRLTYNRGRPSAKILENVFNYAFSHGVQQLEAKIIGSSNVSSWPVCPDASFESLTSLKLESMISMSCPFLGPRSGLFKNLAVLYLKIAVITDVDPFSGFPVLESLTLDCCFIETDDETLSVHTRNLSDLTMSNNFNIKCCELTTPRLKFFHFEGYQCHLPLFQTHEGLPVLDTMEFGFTNVCCNKTHQTHEKRTLFDNMLTLFCAIDEVKSLTLFPSTIGLMSSFREEVVGRGLAFRNLKCLKLDLPSSNRTVADAKVYLIQNSPDAKVIIIDHPFY